MSLAHRARPRIVRTTRQCGAALLAAMLTVTLVATLAAAALWQQWRGVEVEAAERVRVQSGWLLTGALDWARLILREDARAGGADHLAEPWAVPLQEARLSTFLAANETRTDTERDAFLAGSISDLQARLNVTSLIDGDTLSAPARASFARLFELLGLPASELNLLTDNLRRSRAPAGSADSALAPLPPQRLGDLLWLGLSPRTLQLIEPYVTVLPAATPVNLNTASAEVIYACVPGLDLAGAKRLVAARDSAPFRTLNQASQALGTTAGPLVPGQHGVVTRYFEIRGRLRLDQSVVEERSVVQRDGLDVRTLWRDRVARTDPAPQAR